MSDVADFIDRNEFMRLIQEAYQAAAEKAGTHCKDVVTVVRCKNCKYCKWNYRNGRVCTLNRLYRNSSITLEPESYFREVEPDNFCSWGERREDDKTADKCD